MHPANAEVPMSLVGMSWTDMLAIVNGAGLVFAVGLVTIVGFGTLLFRRW